MEQIKTVLIGHGHLGKWHADKIQNSELAILAGVVEFNEASHAEISKKFPNVEIVKTVDQLTTDYQAAVIATPTSLHFEIAKNLISNGIHVFCEKPICDNLDHAIELGELFQSRHSNLIFQIGHSERVHACWEKEKVSNALKQASLIEIDRVAPFKGRATDVSVIQDLMIHDIDILLFQCDFKIKEIKAVGQKVLSNNYDFVTAFFESTDGRLAKITASRVDPIEKRLMRTSYSKGVLSIDLFKKEIHSFCDEKLAAVDSYETRDHLAIEQNHFYRSINDRKDNPVFCTMEEAIKVQEVMEEIEEVLAASDGYTDQ